MLLWFKNLHFLNLLRAHNYFMSKTARYALIACTALFFTLSAWSFGAPIGEGGDGDHHLSGIWCGWGESKGMCENRGNFGKGYVATVPYMFQMCDGRPSEDVTTCQYVTTELKPDNMQTLRTSAPQTRNLYYSLMRIFASENPTRSVLEMRFFNSLLPAQFYFFCSHSRSAEPDSLCCVRGR